MEWLGFLLLGLVFANFPVQGLSRLLTRPNGAALWKPATFEKVDKAFALGFAASLGWGTSQPQF